MSKLSSWDNDDLPEHFFGTFNDIWGYVDENGREYAIMGSASYIHFFDVTDPENPVEIRRFQGGSQTTWRDFKTYQNRAYGSADSSGEGIHIFDLSNLPDTVIHTNQITNFFGSAHNIFIDEPNGRLYAAGSNTQNSGLIVLDIATNPDQPALLGSVSLPNAGFVHDLYVRDNIVYASHGNSDKLVIWDFTDPADPQYIASFDSNGYNHSNWVSEDGNTLIFAEEVPSGLPLGILDISDMENDNLELYTYFKFPLLAPEHENNVPHNPYILGDFVFTSYYEDGLQVFDISDPANPFVAGYYDTYPSNDQYNDYRGCWGVYPFLPSGNIIASDMSNGLFVLRFDGMVNTKTSEYHSAAFHVFPNPANEQINITLHNHMPVSTTLEIFSIAGHKIKEKVLNSVGNETIRLDISDLPAGMYFLHIGGVNSGINKFVKY